MYVTYAQFVRKPVCMNDIMITLEHGRYRDIDAFAEDVRLLPSQ